MPVNPDHYRKILAEEHLTPEHEDLIIHNLSAILEGLMDLPMHALDRMRFQTSHACADSKTDQRAIPSSATLPNKEET